MSAADDRAGLESELLRRQIRLYLYGELSLGDRKEIERFRAQDAEFSALFDDEEAFLLSLNADEIDRQVDSMLADCRDDLLLAVAAQGSLHRRPSPFRRLGTRLAALRASLAERPLVRQLAMAALLVVVGFFAGRGAWHDTFLPSASQTSAVLGDPLSFDAGRSLTGIETVHLDPVGGQIRIVLEERRVVTGESSDPFIRGMLMNTMQASNAGARLSSLEALQAHASDLEVRRILLRSMLEDQNAGVRLKALDTVKQHVDQQDVRDALVQALRTDPIAGVRIHAIQLLGEHPGRDIAGALQELVELEANPFVVQESERILEALGASMERF